MPIISAVLPRMALLVIFSISLITYAKSDNPTDKFAEAKAEPQGDVPVIKLEDIMAGKHLWKKPKNRKKIAKEPSTTPPTITKRATEHIVKKTIIKPTITPTIKKPVAKEPIPVSLEEAYSILMHTTDNPSKKVQSKTTTASPATPVSNTKISNTKSIQKNSSKKSGWIYLGKFSQGKWDNQSNQTLGLNAALPSSGQYYSLRVHSNIRNNYPSKRGIPAVREVLHKGSKVRVLAIHNSGGSGHYWAKIEW